MSTIQGPLEHALPRANSLLETQALSKNEILSLFDRANAFRKSFETIGRFVSEPRATKVVACLFLEPSTRTRLSFEVAAQRLGHSTVVLDSVSSSSLSKGESYTDTVLTIAAMKPDALVIRYGVSEELDQLLPTLKMSVINAGCGTLSHPTQGLLDALTLSQVRKLEGLKVLIVGDVAHSRVARSDFDVLSKLGCEIAVCGPEQFIPNDLANGIRVFEDLDEATTWADVYMGLRVQLERHDDKAVFAREEFNQRFGLNPRRLKMLRENALILHPGPINFGVEFTPEVFNDSRYKVLDQVTNGVYVRAAILDSIFDGRKA